VTLMDEERRQVSPRGIRVRRTIIPEKIDRVIADVQLEVEGLQHYLAELRLARAHVGLLQVKERRGRKATESGR